MSSFSIESAAQWIGSLLLQEVQFLAAVRDKVEELQCELEWMQCFMFDADGKQNNNALLRKWVSEIRDLALDAEDVVETYILQVSQKRPKSGLRNDLKWLACFWKDAKTLHNVGSEIDAITSKISKMSLRLKTYGVKSSYEFQLSHAAVIKKSLAEQRRTYSHVKDNDAIGLKERVESLNNQLEKGSQKIIVVHGMGGIGKTTLAREVLHHSRSKGHFVGFAWVYVSQQLQLGAVFRDIFEQIIPKEDAEEKRKVKELPDTQLPGALYNYLKQNKYLIVLDDVWTLEDWKLLTPAFPVDCDTKLLITTRNPQILSDLGDDVVSYLRAELLDEDNSWKLLESEGNFRRDDLGSKKDVAEKMLKHCNGHPLAILALGGVLATKKSLQEWESVFDNLPSHLEGDESYSGVYEVLAMSYYDLPYNLKACFLHLGNFPEDYRIGVERLYHLWIAEGVVSSTQDQISSKRSLEDVADIYMNQLVQKSMIQVVERDSDGRISTCTFHDLMRDKCLELTKAENFLQMVDSKQEEASEDALTQKVRRVTMYVGHEAGDVVLKTLLGKVESLRSLLFFPIEDSKEESCEWIKSICEKCELLRVLDFEDIDLKGTLPMEVGNLIYLRYLSLKGTHVTVLPPSIGNLRFLLILDLRVKNVIIRLPNLLPKMRSLRYLYFPCRKLSQEVDRCQGYEIEDGGMLILDKLNDLERVESVDLDRVDVKGLVELKSMRKLSASCVSKKESLVPFLKSPSIKHLSLYLNARIVHDDPMLLSACSSLHFLHIDAERSPPMSLPIKFEMFPHNLVELGFWYCKLPEDPMPILEKLPKLRNLQLRICYQGTELKNASPKAFPELTFLMLDGLFSLRKWTVVGGFPKLQKIEIWNCPLRMIPDALPPSVVFAVSPNLRGLVDQFRRKNKV